MRVAVDAHVLGTRAGGNETYMRELLRALAAHPGDAEIVALLNPHAQEELSLPQHRLSTASSYTRMLYGVPLACRRIGADLAHVQYTGPLWRTCPYVVSLHDLVAAHFPETMPAGHRYRLQLMTGMTVRRAARIFVLTRAVQADIAERYGVAADRFDLVQPPVDPAFCTPCGEAALRTVRARYALPDHYLLYVGLIQPRKNLERLAAAFARVCARGADHSLVIAGRRAWLYADLVAAIERLGLGDRIHFTDYVAAEDLPALYQAADAFAYLSLYEGFGIPVLEALASGVPTLASTDPALAEVVGGAALHVAPCDIDAIAAGLEQVLGDSELRARLRREGPARAAAFTAERMALAARAGYAAALT